MKGNKLYQTVKEAVLHVQWITFAFQLGLAALFAHLVQHGLGDDIIAMDKVGDFIVNLEAFILSWKVINGINEYTRKKQLVTKAHLLARDLAMSFQFDYNQDIANLYSNVEKSMSELQSELLETQDWTERRSLATLHKVIAQLGKFETTHPTFVKLSVEYAVKLQDVCRELHNDYQYANPMGLELVMNFLQATYFCWVLPGILQDSGASYAVTLTTVSVIAILHYIIEMESEAATNPFHYQGYGGHGAAYLQKSTTLTISDIADMETFHQQRNSMNNNQLEKDPTRGRGYSELGAFEF
tara:strand:+ start:270 stop:1163 length:894 start_codon:yes stop_codon:yes gene_type:complete